MFIHQKFEDANDYVTILMKKIYKENGFTIQMFFLIYVMAIVLKSYAVDMGSSLLSGLLSIVGVYICICTRKVFLSTTHNVSKSIRDYDNAKKVKWILLVFMLFSVTVDVTSFLFSDVDSTEIQLSIMNSEIEHLNIGDSEKPSDLSFVSNVIWLMPTIIFIMIYAAILPTYDIAMTFILFSSKKSSRYAAVEIIGIYGKYKEYLFVKLLPCTTVIAIIVLFLPMLGINTSDTFNSIVLGGIAYYMIFLISALASYEERKVIR